jgi:hypothetical protein
VLQLYHLILLVLEVGMKKLQSRERANLKLIFIVAPEFPVLLSGKFDHLLQHNWNLVSATISAAA